MNHENDTDPASPSSRHKAAASAPVAFPSSTNGTDPGIGSVAGASASPSGAPQAINCPPPSDRPQVPSPPVTQPRLPQESSTSPAPAPLRMAANAGTPLPPPPHAGSNDSMDVLLEAIGSQDKPFVPKRTSASAGERSAAYEGQARAVPPATTDPTPAPSVIVTLPDPMPPTVTKKIPRREVDSALKMAGAASLPKRAENTTVVVDPPGPSNKLLRWTVAGVLIAACFVGAAGIHNAVEKARENHTTSSAATVAAAPAATEGERGEAPRAEPPPAPPPVAVEHAPIEPVRAVLPELPPKKGPRNGRAPKVPSGLSETEAAQAATAAAMAAPSTPASVAAPKKPKPNVPGLEDLKTEY